MCADKYVHPKEVQSQGTRKGMEMKLNLKPPLLREQGALTFHILYFSKIDILGETV